MAKESDTEELARRAAAGDSAALDVLLAAIGPRVLEEIAGQLGIPVGTLKSRIHHARRHVRESLQG
ncbi:hypothetical protein LADH09A_005780 [Micromonospora sp. LAH09]|uniref:sigma factor-like helix-turn-helix DNA-binding protein n=1 Tax=Micromonospora cabrerizensis TaxID=2911213 RepID=UPI001EE9041F|nr:sigma factor-like helix-turn-helix DNA-binding protein [Micromonospora cabrerizensis]MCG5471778.1 hypothetical protein [Micromonospora cabrerizensis]